MRNAPRGRPRKGPFFLLKMGLVGPKIRKIGAKDDPIENFLAVIKINTIVLATRNHHKVMEIQNMLGSGFQIRGLRDFNQVPDVAETAATFEGNATLKAVSIANWLAGSEREEWFVLADDSGLEVDPLDGAPGVNSARFAASDKTQGNSPDAENNAKLLRLLEAKPRPWRARFRCVLALTPVPMTPPTANTCLLEEAEFGARLFAGACEGQVVPTARGAHGFGYDPLFVPDGFEQSFAELGEEIKNRISHRAQAMKKLKAAILA